jgi:hypothetical protein
MVKDERGRWQDHIRRNPWLPDPYSRPWENEAARTRRRAFMGSKTEARCRGCRWYNTVHCVERAQLHAWRGVEDCYEPRLMPGFQPRTLV